MSESKAKPESGRYALGGSPFPVGKGERGRAPSMVFAAVTLSLLCNVYAVVF